MLLLKMSPTSTTKVEAFLKEHDCGNRQQDNYGDDWSHYDIECLVELACKLESSLATSIEEAFREGCEAADNEWMSNSQRATRNILWLTSNARKKLGK